MNTSQLDSLIADERKLIADLEIGIGEETWIFKRGSRGGTASYASFVYALSMPDAPIALAMLRAYVGAIGLTDTDNWSVSAMPSWAGPTELQRFATISSGKIELFYVWFESRSGKVYEWGIRVPPSLADEIPEIDDLLYSESENGDVGIHGKTLGLLYAILSESGARNALVKTFRQRRGPRRGDWHNSYLGELLSVRTPPDSSDSSGLAQVTELNTEEDAEFERRYIYRITKHRLHQSQLREAALRRHGTSCRYCGLEVPQVLEAAHIKADAEGGAATTANILILCANHHTAFDAGLLALIGDTLVPTPGSPLVAPVPNR
ncbi:HNH endonuclease [Brevibacterium sp. R8603A2]|uniref:HNH endonuclease n=1 Tax=Brevibacterium sp. R8603A2 TaxID=2929779 RepID=UPI001FF7F8A6|nr:HNH endonuclease [Brevibacterium sp. R8603A2]MCK1802796.1 HNH endonuclease [Brevibacterium sp. R8603A2]